MDYGKYIPEAACGVVDEIKRMCAEYEEEIAELRDRVADLEKQLADAADRERAE